MRCLGRSFFDLIQAGGVVLGCEGFEELEGIREGLVWVGVSVVDSNGLTDDETDELAAGYVGVVGGVVGIFFVV